MHTHAVVIVQIYIFDFLHFCIVVLREVSSAILNDPPLLSACRLAEQWYGVGGRPPLKCMLPKSQNSLSISWKAICKMAKKRSMKIASRRRRPWYFRGTEIHLISCKPWTLGRSPMVITRTISNGFIFKLDQLSTTVLDTIVGCSFVFDPFAYMRAVCFSR